MGGNQELLMSDNLFNSNFIKKLQLGKKYIFCYSFNLYKLLRYFMLPDPPHFET